MEACMKRLFIFSDLPRVLLAGRDRGFAQKQVVVGSKIDTEGALLGKMIVKLLAAKGHSRGGQGRLRNHRRGAQGHHGGRSTSIPSTRQR